MGKKSIKENKNIYQKSREELNLTREQASELLEYITSDRIEKIESEKSLPHPEEVLTMSQCYKKPELCNYYCTHECAIGEKYISPLEIKELPDITISMLSSLNRLHLQKERLIDIVEDGKIDVSEYEDFKKIKKDLDKISNAVDTLKIWLERKISTGEINQDLLEGEKKQ